MLCALSPFRELEPEPREVVLERIQGGSIIKSRIAWMSISEISRDLVEALVKVPEAERLRPDNALAHRFMLEGSQLSRFPRHLEATGEEVGQTDFALGDSEGKACAVLILHLLERFSKLDQVQQLALAVCAQAAPESLIQHVEAALPWYDLFFSFDADKDGRLGFYELQSGLLKLYGSDLQTEAFGLATDGEYWGSALRILDINGDGFIDWGEWSVLAMMSDKELPERTSLLRTAFRILDRPSGDNRLAADDLLFLVENKAGLMPSGAEVWTQVDELLRRWSPPGREPPQLRFDDFCRVLAAVELPKALQNAQKVVESGTASSFLPEDLDAEPGVSPES